MMASPILAVSTVAAIAPVSLTGGPSQTKTEADKLKRWGRPLVRV